MKYVIEIQDVPPTLNTIIFKAKRHWAIYASMKKAWKKIINDAINPNMVPFINPVTVKITFYYADKRKRDPDNHTAKMILDGLTKKENPNKFLIPDDSEIWITDVHLMLRKGEIKKTVIEITDDKEDMLVNKISIGDFISKIRKGTDDEICKIIDDWYDDEIYIKKYGE